MDGTQYILFIDDDPLILRRVELCLFHAASQSNSDYRLIRMSEAGTGNLELDSLITKDSLGLRAPGTTGKLSQHFVFFTASDYKQALDVLALPYIDRLTIVSDLGMPGRHNITLLSLLESLAFRCLPVNLLFASAEQYKRLAVQKLIDQRKAYFVLKGTDAWADLPYAIVNNSQAFRYLLITRHDLEGWKQSWAMPSPLLKPPTTRHPLPINGSPLEWQL